MPVLTPNGLPSRGRRRCRRRTWSQAFVSRPLSRHRDIQRNDLDELHGIHELPEARGLAIPDIPDVYCGLVQVLSRSLAGPGVASDYGNRLTGCHELLGRDREVLHVFGNRAKDLLSDSIPAAMQASVWHPLSLVPLDVL